MKAVSLWQPWATAIALGAKRFETRSWGTRYRGPLAIHAAKRCNKDEIEDFLLLPGFSAALAPIAECRTILGRERLRRALPFGAIVATCELADCIPTVLLDAADLDKPRRWASRRDAGTWTERQMGDFRTGRVAWRLENVRKLDKPIPWRGAQGLFEVELPAEVGA